MIHKDILLPILGLIATLALLFGIKEKNINISESFINVPRKVVSDPLVRMNGNTFSALNNVRPQNMDFQNIKKMALLNNTNMAIQKANNAGFVSVANYQPTLQTRFSPMGYNAQITYKMPPAGLQAVTPMDPSPLDYGNMVKEEYNAPSKPKQAPEYLSAEDLMPSQTMENVNQVGDTYQVQRLIYSNSRTRLLAASDYIRGDAPVAPCAKQVGWFQSRYANATNLNQGALVAMGGLNNDTAKATAQLISSYSGVAPSAIAGSPITGSVSKEIGIGPHRESVNVSAFP